MHENQSGKIDTNLLICWGFVLCKRNDVVKTRAWWNLISDPILQSISADDSYFVPIMKNLYYVVTTVIYARTIKFSDQPAVKSEEEQKERWNNMLFDGDQSFIDKIFAAD